MASRIAHPGLAAKVTSADQAAGFIDDRMTVGMSGFTGSGYPKAVPLALARRIAGERAAGRDLRVKVWTGASTGPELDGALAEADGIELRLPQNQMPLTVAWTLEMGAETVANATFGDFGDLRSGGFVLHTGIGLRF